ncbi:tyrosine-type recombinase/integrase [Candidatus Pacearchaeota archaeon]|nr:tyrosine-type recombinase/integrase [Candidatus Pacearchaeota archaeon]
MDNKDEKEVFLEYIEYRKGRGLNSEKKIKDTERILKHLRKFARKTLHEINLKQLYIILNKIKKSEYGELYKNEMIIILKNFLKWKVDNWSLKLKLDDVSLIKKPKRVRQINNSHMFKKKDIEKLVMHETKMYWKAFLLSQYEGGLRTIETRTLKWKDITFDVDGDISEISIYATKTKEPREIYIKEASFYLKKLKEEQTNLGTVSSYVFPAPKDNNKPISQSNVSMWFKRLCKRVLGRDSWNYLLRHSRGNELYTLSTSGEISKDIAVGFMGHSEKMSAVYTHMKADKIKAMMKKQIYKLEHIPKKTKEKYEERIEVLEKTISNFKSEHKENYEKMSQTFKLMIKLIQKNQTPDDLKLINQMIEQGIQG